MSTETPADDVNGSLRRLIADCRSNAEAWAVGRIYVNHPLEIHARPATTADSSASAARLRGALRIAESGLLPMDLGTIAALVEAARTAHLIGPAATGVDACERTLAALGETAARTAVIHSLRSAAADGAAGAEALAARLEKEPGALIDAMRGAGGYFDSLADPPLVRYLLTRGTPLFPKYLYEEQSDRRAP